jgi:hypothetical protein
METARHWGAESASSVRAWVVPDVQAFVTAPRRDVTSGRIERGIGDEASASDMRSRSKSQYGSSHRASHRASWLVVLVEDDRRPVDPGVAACSASLART